MSMNVYEQAPHDRYGHDVRVLFEQALRGEQVSLSAEAMTDDFYRAALAHELGMLLWHERYTHAEHLVKTLQIPEEVLHTDAVRTPALHQLVLLERGLPESLTDLQAFMHVFCIPEEEMPSSLREYLTFNQPQYRKAA